MKKRSIVNLIIYSAIFIAILLLTYLIEILVIWISGFGFNSTASWPTNAKVLAMIFNCIIAGIATAAIE